MKSLPDGYRALVIGASGAIGSAFVAALQADPRCGQVIGLHRRSEPALDLDDEASVARAAQRLQAQGPIHLIVHAAGVLHTAAGMPEKRLAQLNYRQMSEVFRINTFGPGLVLAHFAPLLCRERGVMALLSAKVGSIGDNRLGGWYSYRASKAALNMLVKTAAIEVQRSQPQAVLVAVHPGTVSSGLSAPFKGGEIGRPATAAVADMLAVLDGLRPEQSGGFFAYDGQALPW
ncbi:SDR family NAD(P)-dependent oxidoreductase [Ideonella sp.]|jgi:NAD(P)-dependent dehydrogenase (short-subunit alcohol dehydrogenase family)|uniref:SDR family NAD(P)-dependent oxidoreductase n=1 Tax=Ideonella sp. TaxID=1929293 RepID=UPI0037BE216C